MQRSAPMGKPTSSPYALLRWGNFCQSYIRTNDKRKRQMICFPNAKLNLGLAVTSRRSDGYHTLETVFVPLPLHDVLEVEPTEREYDTLYITSHGYVAEPTNNLRML